MDPIEPIDQRYAEMYIWTLVSKSFKEATIKIPIAQGVDPSIIKCELSLDKESLAVYYPNHPPFVSGCSFIPFESATPEIVDGFYEVHLVASQTHNWDILFTSPHKYTQILDPLSSFSLFHLIQNIHDNSNESNELAYNLIYSTAEIGFAPAILAIADLMQKQKKYDAAFQYLSDKFITVKHPLIAFRLALINYQLDTEDGYKNAFEYCQVALQDPAISQVRSILGLYYSPLSRVPFHDKNAQKAAEYFQEALKINEEEIIALQHFPLLLYTGTGIKKNRKLARELNQRCRNLDANVPTLEQSLKAIEPLLPPKTSTAAIIGIAAASVGLIAGTFFLINHFRKRQN